MKFPREVWAGSHLKNARQFPRRIVKNKKEYIEFISAQNGKTNLYTTVYDFADFSNSAKVEDSIIRDRIFLDFDAHEDSLDMAFRDVRYIMEHFVVSNDYKHTLFFSGRGFHLFLFGEETDDMRNIQQLFREIKSILVEKFGEVTIDDRVGQATRLRRIPNTANLASGDENNNPYFCIPLTYDDLTSTTSILEMAKEPRKLSFEIQGNNLVVFPEMPPLEEIQGEVNVPEIVGNLPILPCLYNAIMTENPSHMARAYLVSWYRDLLSQCRPLSSMAEKESVLNAIVEEIKINFGEREDVWLDWCEQETRKHARFTVYGNYKTPNCKTKLIPEGYCIGKCWRFPIVKE